MTLEAPTVELRCPDPDCETVWGAGVFEETGRVFFVDDDRRCCPACGEEGETLR